MKNVNIFKGIMILFFLISLWGCDDGKRIYIKDFSGTGNCITTIERPVYLGWDPTIQILSRKAYFEKGEIIIEGPISILGYNGESGWAFKKMRVENNKLIISIPEDCEYHVKIILIPNLKK